MKAKDIRGAPALLSICVPAYNGLPHLIGLLDQILSCKSLAFEVVVSDDASSDGTWAYLVSRAIDEPRLRVYLNDQNLGMDRNFATAVSLAYGRFVWLCGQDDLISPEGIGYVLDLLRDDSVDFVYMNHTVKLENNVVPVIARYHSFDADKRGEGLADFLKITGGSLPTFLPTYIIRKTLWDSVDVTRYFNTYYVQAGVFLEVAQKIRWIAVSQVYVVGLVLSNGWQENTRRYANIIVGYFLMINRVSKKSPFCESYIKMEQYRQHFLMLVFALLNCRRENIQLDAERLSELRNSLGGSRLQKLSIDWLLKSPRMVVVSAWMILNIVRGVRHAIARTGSIIRL
ncbi:MAG: glycosyltransferase family 2 protein [Gammaproteobacteria bacterium]|nr:glycosyltransferase family 2 protein [Gammaproteobacteria bacterium]